ALAEAVRAGIVGPAGAMRAWADRLLPPEPVGHMEPSVAEMARRRFGREWTDRVIAPLIGGVFGVAPTEVSFLHAYPDTVGTRSLIAAARRRPRPSGPQFLSVAGGMGRMADALAAELRDVVDVRTASPAEAMAVAGEKVNVATGSGDVAADGVVLAVPAPTAARLLEPVGPEAAAPLRDIRYSA